MKEENDGDDDDDDGEDDDEKGMSWKNCRQKEASTKNKNE